MRTYYIVKSVGDDGFVEYSAHTRGVLSTFNIFGYGNIVTMARAETADICENKLRAKLKSQGIKPIIVQVLKI